MSTWRLFLRPLDNPARVLVYTFIAWKSLLLFIAICSPGPGYDTSTALYHGTQNPEKGQPFVAALLSLVSSKLTKWDAIYFTKAANRGYLYEQEWAFGWGMTRLIKFFAKDLRDIGFDNYDFVESFVGITLSHASHAASVLVLHILGRALFPTPSGRRVAFIAACLHIFSPAGLFLSAPYGESTCSLLAFLGCLCFVQSCHLTGFRKDLSMVVSGTLFGLATTVRSNALLYGFMFLEEAFRAFLSLKDGPNLSTIRRLAATGTGGLSVAAGFFLPQYIAYQDFCGASPAVWCNNAIPSVYTYIQKHYWGVGFLQYWKLSNIPLFFLAMPMLAILTISSLWTFRKPVGFTVSTLQLEKRLLRSLAIPQLLLAVLALTSYHVQIITRISSSYPVWYLWLAAQLIDHQSSEAGKGYLGRLGSAVSIVRYMVIYAVVQGGLFASFLPPA